MGHPRVVGKFTKSKGKNNRRSFDSFRAHARNFAQDDMFSYMLFGTTKVVPYYKAAPIRFFRHGLRHDEDFYAAGCVFLVEDLLGCLYEVFRLGVWNVGESLRVAVCEREP